MGLPRLRHASTMATHLNTHHKRAAAATLDQLKDFVRNLAGEPHHLVAIASNRHPLTIVAVHHFQSLALSNMCRHCENNNVGVYDASCTKVQSPLRGGGCPPWSGVAGGGGRTPPLTKNNFPLPRSPTHLAGNHPRNSKYLLPNWSKVMGLVWCWHASA
jgi:hypothetical protein